MIRQILLIASLLTQLAYSEVQVLFKADLPINDQQWARLRIQVKNTGTTTVSSPKAAFDLNVPAGKVAIVESWSVGSVKPQLEQRADGTWRLWLTLTGDLAPGLGWNGDDGVSVGVHLTDYANWQPWTSPSFAGNTGTWAVDQLIYVWDATGRQIWGQGTSTGPVSSPVGISTLQVDVGTGGSCNVTGTVVLATADHLDLRCQEKQGFGPAKIWIDGVVHAGTDSATVIPDGKDHLLQAVFPARAALWSNVTVQGNGACSPVPTAMTYQGDSLWVACAAGDKNRLVTMEVDGIQKTPSPRYGIGNLQKAVNLSAVFLPTGIPNANLSVQASRDVAATSGFSAFKIQVKNNGTFTIPSGWSVLVPFRVPSYLTPVINNWDVPSAATSLSSYGEGWYLLKIVSSQALAPGATGGDGRGWYVALSLTQNNSNWDRTGDVALPATATWTNAPYIRVIAADGNPLAGQEWLMQSTPLSRPTVQVFYLDNGASTNYLRPQIVLKNLGPAALSDFVYDYFFCTEGGKIPYLEPWYGVPSVHIEALGGFCYKTRYNFLGVTVPPGGSLPDFTGNILGLHYSDFSTWDRANDWSHTNNTQTLALNLNIPVYDKWGNLLTGNEWTAPGNPGYHPVDPIGAVEDQPVPPVIVSQPADVTVGEGGKATFEVRAAGDGALTYQWRKNGLDLVGATSPVLVLDQVRAEMDGDHYLCKVTGAKGWVLSRDAVLHVKRTPQGLVIRIQPVDDTVSLGAQGRFEVYATGPDGLTYQWYQDARALKGETSSRLQVPVASGRDTIAKYWVRVKDPLGRSIDSRSVRLHLRAPGSHSIRMVISGAFARASGELMPDTTIDLKARLFSARTGGDPLWTESHWDVPVLAGNWDVVIGESAARSGLLQVVASRPTLFLELVLDGGIPRIFGPRIPLTATPFAMQGGGRILLGTGVPTRTDLNFGTLFLDQATGKTWFRDATGWRPLD